MVPAQTGSGEGSLLGCRHHFLIVSSWQGAERGIVTLVSVIIPFTRAQPS